MSNETVTIELPANHALVKHIEDLQRVITKRNAEVEALKQRLDGEGESEQMQRARRDGFKSGWEAHRDIVGSALSDAELAIRKATYASWARYVTPEPTS